MRYRFSILTAVLLSVLTAGASEARVVRLVVEQRRPFADGRAFGSVGPYERLDGIAYFEIDPRDPLNAGIVNVDKAPRNARGYVEFNAPFYILMPLDPSRGSHKLYVALNNRGGSGEWGRLNLVEPAGAPGDPSSAPRGGDGFLMRLGYTVVDVGWQGNVTPGNNRLVPTLPVARMPDGGPIVASVRVQYSDRDIRQPGTFSLPLEGGAGFRSYEAADTNPAHSKLTVRDLARAPRTPISPDRWAFGRCATGRSSLVPGAADICLFDGFQPDKLYELVYPAKNPIVMGLGHAVVRDLTSFLRYEKADAGGNANPLAAGPDGPGVRRAYASGSSQTAMYLREYVFLGFNEDESHRKAFDAITLFKSGTSRTFANVEFADPNIYSAERDRHDFLMTSYPPFTYAVTVDPLSGVRAGILSRPATDPFLMDIHTETEYYQFRGSLNLADGKGKAVPMPDKVRTYLLDGLQHTSNAGSWSTPPAGPRGSCQNPTNLTPSAPTSRALLVALDAWVDRGVAPPDSRVPTLRDGTLVTLEDARRVFPSIPGVAFAPALNELAVLDYGRAFGPTGGRLTILPPTAGPAYKILVPKPDADGIGQGGVRVVETAVPRGTVTGWNMLAGTNAHTCGIAGSFVPFAATKAERLATGDPRPSVEERYKDHQGYVDAVRRVAAKLVEERLLLPEDAEHYIQEAAGTSDVLSGRIR